MENIYDDVNMLTFPKKKMDEKCEVIIPIV